MGVPLPGGHHEDVAFGPIKFVRRDLGHALTTKCVIDGRARVTMRFGFLPGTEKLDGTGTGREGMAAIDGVGVFQDHAVVRISCAFLERI